MPAMRSNISLQEEQWHFGEDAIFEYLRDKKVLMEMPHKTHSVWEKQGVEFAKEKLAVPLDTLFLSPMVYLASNVNS